MVHNLRQPTDVFCVIEVGLDLGTRLLNGTFNPLDHQIPPHKGMVELTKEQSIARFVNNIFCTLEIIPQPHRAGYYVIVRRIYE